MLKIRASHLGLVMTEPKSKSEKLSAGAKTYIEQLAKECVYGYQHQISTRYTDKGMVAEIDSISLYNSVFFKDHKKNTERKKNTWLTGMCDIDTGDKIIDIKTSWSLHTFPATKQEGMNSQYEWQGRAYMMLWERDEFELAYCMVNTPEELIGNESEEMHIVDHINESNRVTVIPFYRDAALEQKIIDKVNACDKYFTQCIEQISRDHEY